MSQEWLERYAAVYVTQTVAGGNPEGPEMAALKAAYAPNGRYLDIPSNAVWETPDGIGQMFVITYNFSHDLSIRIDRKFTDGKNFLLEGVATGINTTPLGEYGKDYTLPYASTGWFNDDGLVEEHHDHWDRKGWLVQIGAEQPTHWLNTEESWSGAVMDPADDFRRAGNG